MFHSTTFFMRLARGLLAGLLLWLSACSAPTLPPVVAPSPTPKPRLTATRSVPLIRPTFTPSPSLTPTSAIQGQPADLKGLSIQFWHPLRGSAQLALEQLTAEFNRDNSWGLSVQLTAFDDPQALAERLSQSDPLELPQILSGYPAQLQTWQAGAPGLVDLTPYANDPSWGLSAAEQTDFLPAAWMQDIASGLSASGAARRLGLPWYRSARLLLYNRTWAEELGFSTPPSSLSQFESQACAAAVALRTDSDSQNDGRGGWLIQPDPDTLGLWIWAFDGEFFNANGYDYTTPSALAAATSLIEWAQKGCVWGRSEPDPIAAMLGRQALFILLEPEEISELQAALKSAGSSDRWQALALPHAQQKPFLLVSGPALAVVPGKPQQQLAAWAFIRWLSSVENQVRWSSLTGAYPSRFAAADQLQADAKLPAAWKEGLELLQYARSEPAVASWEKVRWAQAEALQMLLKPGPPDPTALLILKNLELLANELEQP